MCLATAFANDLREGREYDLDGRITSYAVEDSALGQDIVRRTLAWGDNRNLTEIADVLNPSDTETYGYTANGFRATADGPWGELAYTIDGVGNITQRSVTIGGVTTVDTTTLESGTNRLQSIATGGVTSRSFQSDAAGNVTDDDLVSPATTKDYTYNAAGQLVSASVNSTAAGAYVYDYLSRLIERAANAVTLHRVHDLDGNVFAEYKDTSALLIGPYCCRR